MALTPDFRHEFLKGKKCTACGSTENLTVDHIDPKNFGGTDDIENLGPLCQSCNSQKRDKDPDYWWRYYARRDDRPKTIEEMLANARIKR